MLGDFKEMLETRFAAGAHLCVGLDPTLQDRRKLHNPNSVEDIVQYLVGIVDATAPFAAAFKPNRAFYDAMRWIGDEVLRRVVAYIRLHHPSIPVILDNKSGDIGSTNDGYLAKAQELGVHAVTLSPYMGGEALKPFLESGLYSFVLCKTSNPGSEELQDAEVTVFANRHRGTVYSTEGQYKAANENSVDISRAQMPMYQFVAQRVDQAWGPNAGLVVGATYPEHLRSVLELVAGRVILCPGVGAQGGDPSAAFAMADDSIILVNASRSVAAADDPAKAAEELNEQIKRWMS